MSWSEVAGAVIRIVLAAAFAVTLIVSESLYLGDLITLGVVVILSESAGGWWNGGREERHGLALRPLAYGASFSVQWLSLAWFADFGLSWPGILSIAAIGPVGALLSWPLVRTHGLLHPSARWNITVLVTLYFIMLGLAVSKSLERGLEGGLQHELHDWMGLISILVYALVSRIAITRAMRRDGDAPPERRISLTGL